jgi:hypothetical protein
MNVKIKKSLKIVALFATALIISTASATIYNYMFLDNTVGTADLPLEWVDGPDAVCEVTGYTCTITGMTGPPGGTATYTDAVRLTATGSATFNLEVQGVTGSTDDLDSIIVKVYDGTEQQGTDLTVWSGGVIGETPVTGLSMTDETWRLQWEITWKGTAEVTVDTVNVDLRVVISS